MGRTKQSLKGRSKPHRKEVLKLRKRKNRRKATNRRHKNRQKAKKGGRGKAQKKPQ